MKLLPMNSLQVYPERGTRCRLRTVLKCKKALCWTYRRAGYCQLIQAQNKDSCGHANTCKMRLPMSFGLMKQPSSWKYTTDSAVGREIGNHTTNHALSTLLRFMYGLGSATRGQQEYAYLTCIINADYLCAECLIPFLQEIYPDSHRYMQDNDPKHTPRRAQLLFTQNNVNWWKNPPESPDTNPVENLWHELLKVYLILNM